MNLSYDEFMRIVPSETAQYVKSTLEEMYYHFKLSHSVNGYDGKCDKLVKCFLSSMLPQKNYGSFLREIDFDGSNINLHRDNLCKDQYENLYNGFIGLFCIKDNMNDYKYLMPSELLYNSVKLREENDDGKGFYNSIGVNRKLKYYTNKLVKQDKKLIDLKIENDIFKGMNYEEISYFECASKIREQLIKKIDDNSISESDCLKKIDEYLIPVSLFLAIFEYDGKEVNILEKYLNEKGVTIKDIYKILGYSLSNDILTEDRNMQVIDYLYKPYFSKDIQEVFEKLLNRDLVNNTCIERLLSKFNLKKDDFSNMKSDLLKYKANPEEERLAEIKNFYDALKYSTKDYINDTVKIYQILIKYIGKHELLNSSDDIDSLALLISSYYYNGIVSEFFKDNGVTLEDILGFFNISITKEEINYTVLDKNIVISKFKRFVNSGANNGNNLSNIYPVDVERNLCNKEFNRTTIIQDLFDKFTGKTLSDDFSKDLDRHINLKRKLQEDNKLKDYMKSLPIEDKSFLGFVSSKYNELKNNNKEYIDDRFLIELSIIYASENVFDCREYLTDIGLSYNDLIKSHSVKNSSTVRKDIDVDILKDKFSDLVRDNNYPMDIMMNMLFDKNMSLVLREFLYNRGIKLISREEYSSNKEKEVLKNEFNKKVDKFDEDIKNTIYGSCEHFSYSNDSYSDNDRKYISLFLGLFCDDDFAKILNSKGISFSSVKDKCLTGEISKSNININEVFKDFKLVDTNNFSRNVFINGLFDNELIKKICESYSVSVEELKYELINKKSYEDSLTILQKKDLLEQMDLPELNPFSNTSLLRYSNALNFHSKNIEGPYNELMKSNTIVDATNSIHDTIESLYIEKEVGSKQGFLSKLIFGEQEVEKEIKLNPDAMEKLRNDLQVGGISLEKEIKIYGDLLDYMKAFYKKNKLRIEETEKQIEMLKSQKKSFSDDSLELMRLQSALEILESYRNSFVSTDALFKSEIFKVYNAIVSHFMVLNSIRTTKETLVPIIESEGIIGKGIDNEKDVINVIHEMSSLFNNLVRNNTEGISENLTNLNNCNLSLENYEALTEGINRFLNEAPALTLNPLNKMSEDNKVYKKD